MVQVAALQQQLQAAELQARELLQDRETLQQRGEQKHREAAAQLEEALRVAVARTSELDAQAELAERKVQRLEEQLVAAGAGHRELEAQLARLCLAVCHAVCSTKNHHFTSPAGTRRRRSPSPRRRHLQAKGTFTTT